MSHTFFALVCCSLAQHVALSYLESPNLRLVQVVYRHGDRSPITDFPKSNVPLSFWYDQGSQGYGELTYLGMQQQYELGQFLRERYIKNMSFIHQNYNSSELEVRSTDTDRTLMSAYCNLAGMFPPIGNKTWNTQLKWQPIPVHTRPLDEDGVLYEASVCPQADEILLKALQSAEVQNEEAQNKDFYTQLSTFTGMKQINISNIWQIIDTLFCNKVHNVTLPSWSNETDSSTNKTVYERLIDLWKLNFQYNFNKSEELHKFRGGPLVKDMLLHMTQNLHSSQYPKFYMYSAHDDTLVAFMAALNIYDPDDLSQYASAILVELWQSHTDGKDYVVKVWYKNSSASQELQLMTLPGCVAECPLDRWRSLTQHAVPDDWSRQCRLKPLNTDSKLIIVGTAAGIGVTMALIMIVYIIVRKRGVTPENYNAIDEHA